MSALDASQVYSEMTMNRRKGACKPFTVYDAVKRRCVLIRPWVLFLAGDNPMQAELCSHIGLKGNHFCRICKVGGDREFKCSDAGYASLLKVRLTMTSSLPGDTDTIGVIYSLESNGKSARPVRPS